MSNTITSLYTGIKSAYRSVTSIEHSPLKHFDPVVAHMMFQVLAFMWSGIFSLMLGSYIAFGISATFHLLFVAGVFVTAIVFKEGNRRNNIIRANKYNGRMMGGEHE